MKEESENITFRINSNVLQRLRFEAENNRMRLNSYINQILSSFLEWDAHQMSNKFGAIEKSILVELLRQTDDIEVETISKKATLIENILPLTAGKTDEESPLKAILVLARRSGFTVRTFENNGRKKIVIQHDLGAKWSRFYKTQIEQLLKDTIRQIAIGATDNTLVINLDTDSAIM